MNQLYRPCVLAVFANDQGQVLVAERAKPRGAWQFPQGGIDAGEAPLAALFREMEEELGLRRFEVLRIGAKKVRYDYQEPSGPYRGQEQIWYLARLTSGHAPDLQLASAGEFVAWNWVSPSKAGEDIVAFKYLAYQEGLRLLGLLPAKEP